MRINPKAKRRGRYVDINIPSSFRLCNLFIISFRENLLQEWFYPRLEDFKRLSKTIPFVLAALENFSETSSKKEGLRVKRTPFPTLATNNEEFLDKCNDLRILAGIVI